MCLEDVRMGRRAPASEGSVLVSTTAGLLVPGNRKRIALVISAPITNRLTLSLNPAPVAGVGLTLSAGGAPLTLDVQKHGGLCTQPIYAIVNAGTDRITWWESALEEE